jgi:hypothetical protein
VKKAGYLELDFNGEQLAELRYIPPPDIGVT